MIKVGQIYEDKEKENGKNFVITRKCGDSEIFEMVYSDGRTNSHSADWIELVGLFVAEYPTWQEAVNSPEFRGEKK